MDMPSVASMLHDVFYPISRGREPMKLRGVDGKQVSSNLLTSYKLWNDMKLFDSNVDGISTIFKSKNQLKTDMSVIGTSVIMFFMQYIIKMVITSMQDHDTDMFNPLKNSQDPVIIIDDSKVKTVNFDLSAIVEKISDLNSNEP